MKCKERLIGDVHQVAGQVVVGGKDAHRVRGADREIARAGLHAEASDVTVRRRRGHRDVEQPEAMAADKPARWFQPR